MNQTLSLNMSGRFQSIAFWCTFGVTAAILLALAYRFVQLENFVAEKQQQAASADLSLRDTLATLRTAQAKLSAAQKQVAVARSEEHHLQLEMAAVSEFLVSDAARSAATIEALTRQAKKAKADKVTLDTEIKALNEKLTAKQIELGALASSGTKLKDDLARICFDAELANKRLRILDGHGKADPIIYPPVKHIIEACSAAR
ncbi:MAG TPA: hypothetical protein VG387_16945 [Rhizomicrobium sp.]|jgi:chromosome segregation ATPase|nr:hypothetical protein [Rhizomicrobium sp.]